MVRLSTLSSSGASVWQICVAQAACQLSGRQFTCTRNGYVPVRMSAVTATIMGAHGADCLSAVLRGKTPRPLSFAYIGQGIALGRHNAIGFNNYPDDKPNPPYFTGWLGYLIREGFVRYLATATQRPGIYVWLGKRRYESAQRRQKAREQKKQMQLRRA